MNNRQTIHQWYRSYQAVYEASSLKERVGEVFVDDFLGSIHWEDLYYEEDNDKALGMIVRFLIDSGYYPYVPW
jgi:hypothetical protein